MPKSGDRYTARPDDQDGHVRNRDAETERFQPFDAHRLSPPDQNLVIRSRHGQV
jgi:hypothetical protein